MSALHDLVETHRSFVNTWECDENAHMNVQFYLKRFDEAARFFDMLSAGAAHDGPLPRDRHVRYHAELVAAATTLVRSAAIEDGPYAGRVVHFLEHAETGVLAATAIDAPSGLRHESRIGAAHVERALPRSAPSEPLRAFAPDRILARGGIVSNRSIVGSGECDARARMVEQCYVARLSDGAPHGWKCAGVDVEWLRERNLGRVAVEMKITHHAPAMAGDPLVLYTAPARAGEKTVKLRHEMVRASDGEAIASAEVVALILDLKKRKSIALPEHVVARLQSLVVPTEG